MPQESICIRVPKNFAEKAILLADKLRIIDKGLKIERENDFIYIPLIRQPRNDEVEELEKYISDCRLSTHEFAVRKKRPETLAEILEDKLSSNLLASLPRSIDIVGKIAIMEIAPELYAYEYVVGRAILKLHKNVRTVLAKAGAVGGTHRLREYRVIAGELNTETVHREYGCQYQVDLTKAYFSPRLSYEHNRVASLVQEGETVLDMFTGVGPFAILIAKRHERVKIHAVDSNAHAVKLLKENIIINRVSNEVHPILGDAREVVKKSLVGVADRVIMNLPERAIHFVDAACEALKQGGGIIHFYTFVDSLETLEYVKVRFIHVVERCKRNVKEILSSRQVRSTAPHKWQAVLDLRIH